MTHADRKRILFVDDEPNVLAALRCLLRRDSERWEMVFAPGADAALSELDRGAFDIVVSDMRMPGIDGATLLARVEADSPGTVRLILSGTACASDGVRHVDEVLSKPCRAPSLRATIERWLEIVANR